ncbi:MAG: hypothetical protein H6720_03710 [Sandaracinus sp.]|nr:hypothetical protein [Sandaracinus sp.]
MRDALLCRLVALAMELGPGGVALVVAVLGVLGSVAVAVGRFVTKRLAPGSATPGTSWVAATLFAVAVYTFARLIDPLLASRLEAPSGIDAEVFARVGWFEWRLFAERRWAWPLLPLADHPALGLLLHGLLWPAVIVIVRWVLVRLPSDRRERGLDVLYDTPESALPRWHRWTGATNARRADDRFRRWVRGLVAVLATLHLTAAGLMAASAPPSRPRATCDEGFAIELPASELSGLDTLPETAGLPEVPAALRPDLAPSPGTWIVAALLLFFVSFHLLTEGRPPNAPKKEAKEADDEAEATPPPDPLAKLGAAIRALRPGTRLEALEMAPANGAKTATAPERLGLLARELLETLTGGDTLYTHQREVLDHLLASWQLDAAAGRGPAPALVEEVSRSPIRRSDEAPHALVLAPEGSGRTTLAKLAILHVAFDRGATTLVVLRDRRAARRWADTLRASLERSSARWTLQVCVAGEDLQATLLGGKTPAVVVADLESFEAEVLGDPRSDAFFDRLGLVVVDDVDAFVGVSEMHLHLCMRRLWALADTRRPGGEAAYPLVLLALGGPAHASSGAIPWARHLLAVPLRVFEGDGAPRAHRVLLRRRDLVDGHGDDLPLALLAEACDLAGIPWHARFAGDALRELRRVDTDLTRLRRHHVDDPRDAEVLLLEGSYPDVRREAERLAHAGVRTESGSCVVVLAPPADEEMVLHEEADDAPSAELTRSLPRFVVLAEPDLLRQRHFDRALGREHEVEALRTRFGGAFVDETLTRLDASGRIARRTVWRFDRRRDDALATERLRAVREAALGEPIDADCVSDSSARVRLEDVGTATEVGVVDRAVAPALHPPGSIFLAPSGRHRVRPREGDALPVEPLVEAWRTTVDRETRVEGRFTFTSRQLGGRPCELALGRGEVRETLVGLRRYGPGTEALEHRRLEPPVEARYATDVLLLVTPLGPEAYVPLAAAIRMMVGCALRGADTLLGVDVVTVDGKTCVAFWDRTPGASGYAATLGRELLGELLRLARLVLERLVGRESVRLRRLHDTTPEGDVTPWDLGAALAWLDALLDPPPHARPAPRRPRREHVPGEGSEGDLGRLWMARTGRTEDLVWTRHPFEHADLPRHLDVAVERRALFEELEAARARGATDDADAPREAEAWRATHAGLALDAWELRELRAFLAPLGDDAILALVAALPTRPNALPRRERAPLVALARRRADLDAKALLALALLSDAADPAVCVGEDGVFVRAHGRLFDLAGPTPVVRDDVAPTVGRTR